MTDPTQDDVAQRCRRFAKVAAAGVAWVAEADDADIGAAQRKTLDRHLRRTIRRGARLEAAATSNMAVSVFGPSQNGKSFLVSVLARPEGRPLMTAFDGPGGELSYIRDINPEGEGESTGLVTRFTMGRAATPPGFPVALRLLSLADLAQTLANSFFMDGDKSEPELEASALETHVDGFLARKGRGSGGIVADDLREIADYVDRNFRGLAYAAALRPFLDDAADIAPHLDLADLGAFLAPLWGGYPEFTGLFDTLARGLAALGFAAEAWAPLAALVPRETSIIDVAQLHRIGRPGAGTLDLQLPGGRVVALDRPVVCALTAEFVLPMRDLPDEMFRQTDLLDFPGTRNRFAQPLKATFVDPKGGLSQLLLRGKVAYLFDRYVEDQKINAMLLCIKNSNMESIDLPRLVENWVALTQGATPDRRAQAACILFLCLTFFDMHLVDSAAASGETSRFEKRMYQSLIEKFGTSGWVRNWTPGRKFQNCFWVRNPNYYVEALFDYNRSADPPRESLKPDKAARMAELREGYLAAPLVREHFADPGAAWDAAMAENDGGVTYLKRHLKPVCGIGRKLAQIDGQLRALEEDVHARLQPFHLSDDLDDRMSEKEAAANRVIDGLEHALQERGFGAFIGALMVDQDVLYDRMSRVPPGVRISSSALGGDGGAGGAAALRPRRGTPESEVRAAPRDGTRTLSRPAFQADVAMRTWAEGLERLKDDPRLGDQFGLTPELATGLASELFHAGRRLDLEARLRVLLQGASYGLTSDVPSKPASVLACEAINRFVSSLGFDRLPASERPKAVQADGGAVPIFADPPLRNDVLDLPERPRATLATAWRDWVHALAAVYDANARHLAGASVNPERNAALGRILRDLRRDGGGAGSGDGGAGAA